MNISYPTGLNEIAQQMGVSLGSHTTIDPTQAIEHLGNQLSEVHGDADPFGSEELIRELELACNGDHFGFANPFKALKKKVVKKMAAHAQTPEQKQAILKLATAPVHINVGKSITGLVKGVATGVSTAAFVIPGAGPLIGGAGLSALAAGDKLLSDPRVKNAASVIKNTQALAALGHKEAQRGAATLAAVAQIRTANRVPIGKPAIPVKTPAQAAAVAHVIPQTVLKVTPAQVKQLAVKTAVNAQKQGWLDKFLNWVGLQRKAHK